MSAERYLHLGENVTVCTDEIIGLFDLDGTTVSKRTRQYLADAEQAGDVVYINYELPKSFVVCKDQSRASGHIVYISQLSLSTLTRRLESKEQQF